ncbi:hypothetical protein HYU17_03775 [Candidatus Woesearchaeota archaeon]|nr:hypothetical protein [Candidatus Woesearchaeota archaeon]
MVKQQSKKSCETTAIIAAANELLLKNRRTVAGHMFTIPSPYEYRHQWLWDSCFHAIVLRHFDTEAAEEELRSLMASQKPSGMVPHESKYVLLSRMLPYTSRITQPPIIARAVLDLYKKSRNREFLAEIFPKLQHYHNWLAEKREAGNVLKVVDSNESGEDNSVLWDDELTIPVHRTYLRWLTTYVPFFPQLAAVISVKATSFYADSLGCMAEIAKTLGNTGQSGSYRKKHSAVIAAMAKAFRQKDGLYYSLTGKGKPIPYKTNSLFAPMYCGAATRKEAMMLVKEHLLNEKEFWTQFPIPTVAADEKKFNPKGYWRGPMWVNINWMLHRGLLRYGFKAVADELLQKTIAAVRKSGFREYYNPLTGEGLGARQFGWSTLVADMMLR